MILINTDICYNNINNNNNNSIIIITEISQETRDTIVRELTKELTISPEPVPELHVSPVPTPYISRPSTRADSLKMAGDEELRIMKGNMHIKYAAPTNIIKVFVHSSFTGN